MVAASAAGGVLLLGRPGPSGARSSAESAAPAGPTVKLAAAAVPVKAYTLAGTDGWVSMPVGANAMAPYFPDSFAPPNGNSTGDKRKDLFTTYAFGFRNVSQYNPPTAPVGATSQLLVDNVKNHVQISAPLIYAQAGQDLRLTLFNLGMGNRPDLFDSHTIHFHGFANQIAYFDGVPDASLSVPPGQSLHYRYLPVDAGTYMYHCHVEDVEHVQMGMNGMVFIAPRKGVNYTYDTPVTAGVVDPAVTTRFDRQFSIHLSEIFPQGHYGDAHIQDTDWTDFTGYFRLMNGRAWPDTVKPHAGDYPTGAPGDPDAAVPTTTDPVDGKRLRFQPLSSLIQGESGEYVLVRVSHLGYEQHSLVLEGLPMTVIGQDAKFLGAGRAGYYGDYQYGKNGDPLAAQRVPDPPRGNVETLTNRVDLGPGESRDLLIGPLPSVSAMTVFPFYDREFGYLNGGDNTSGYGGMRTEVHVHPKGGLTRPSDAELALLTKGADSTTLDLGGNLLNNFAGANGTWTYADGNPIVQAFPGKLY
jgi:FtsP/CotA-like multicopper oxidase with cupredoxin domain